MKHFDFRPWVLLLALLAATFTASAQIEPAAQYTTLTPTELMAWTATGPTALPANVSTVPLAVRQNALAPQLNPNMSFSSKVNWCPDGMNNFVGYLNEQPQFNIYNFTHWQYIDVLTWFASPVGIPCRPWVETAHRNGVKVLGTIFTDQAGFVALCEKDAAGNYRGAQKLVDVANYYGFDGWFFNEESDLTTAQATELRNLLKRLQTIKPAAMEIHWYDSMLPSGTVAYQNTLNANNAPLLQESTTRVSDAMFTNYFWLGSATFTMAANQATALGRSPFDVYTGADVWPGRNPQRLFTFGVYSGVANTGWMDAYYNGSLANPRTSLAVFAPNITYNGGYTTFNNNPADYATFYQNDVRLFSGDDLDITTADATGAWKGFGYYQPVRCAITALPFETNFSVGQGKIFANNGVATTKAWTDMAKQAILPSWQWAKTGASTVRVGFDFSRAWYGGTSVQLSGSLAAGASTTVKLYQTKLPITATTNLDVIYKGRAAGASSTRLALYFSDNLAVPEYLDLPAVTDTLWATRTLPLAAYATRELAIVGVQATSATAVAAYRLNLGKLSFYNGTAVAVAPKANFAATATTVLAGQPVTFANSSTNATSYSWVLTGATPSSSTAIHPTVTYATPGTYTVTLQAIGAAGAQDVLSRTAYITVLAAPPSGSNTSLSFDGTSKYVECGTINLSGAAFSLECWVKPNSFKAVSPYISSLIGMEDGGSNTALIRLGDGGIDANQVQFVAQIGTTARKVTSSARLTAGVWTHIAATYDGTAMRLYINGVLDNSLSATGNVVANAPLSLGRNYASSRCLDGRIDEARAWTRALTATEIAANACGVANGPGLEGYWKCNESPNLTATDASGHGHTGTFVGLSVSDWSTDVPTSCVVLATTSPQAAAGGLQARPLENPVPGTRATVEISGTAGQPVSLRLYNTVGALLLVQELKAAPDGTQVTLPLPSAAGMYLLQVRAGERTTTTRLVK